MAHEITIDNAHEPNTAVHQLDSSGPALTGEGAPDNELMEFVPITGLLEMFACCLGVLLWGWATMMLLQGVTVSALETKDRVFVVMMLFFICLRYWSYICPQASGLCSKRVASRVRSRSDNEREQLVVPISFISKLSYLCKLVSCMISVVLSAMQLFSHDFGPTEVANKTTRDFGLLVFYSVAISEAVLLLCALTLEGCWLILNSIINTPILQVCCLGLYSTTNTLETLLYPPLFSQSKYMTEKQNKIIRAVAYIIFIAFLIAFCYSMSSDSIPPNMVFLKRKVTWSN